MMTLRLINEIPNDDVQIVLVSRTSAMTINALECQNPHPSWQGYVLASELHELLTANDMPLFGFGGDNQQKART